MHHRSKKFQPFNKGILQSQFNEEPSSWQIQIQQINKFYSNKSIDSNKKMVNHEAIYLENVFTFKNLPVEDKQRKWTDCCCTILTAIFALVMFVLSFVFFTKINYYQVNFPADDKGMTCYHNLKSYPYMYFADPQNPQSGRYCLKQCPRANEMIKCSDNPLAYCRPRTSSYSTQRQVNNIGAFCSPTDEGLRNKLFSHPELGHKISLTQGYSTIRFALLVGFLVGLLYLTLVGCLAKIMSVGVFALASVVLLAGALYILIRPVYLFTQIAWTIVLAIVLIICAVAFILFIVFYKKQIQLTGILLNYSNQFLKETFTVYFYIPFFLVLTLGLLVLIVWQYIAFGTGNLPTFQRSQIYYHSSHIVILQVLNVIELIWGLQFLRDSFNFVVSGNSVQWYFRSVIDSKHCARPLVRLITKHWGSVVGGSFLNAFFKIFDSVADFFNCDPRENCGKCQNIYEKLCCCNYIFQLIRSDSYAYINLTGIPYCNAARQCEALCRYSQIIKSSHSCVRLYRHAAHIFTVGLSALLSYIIFDHHTNDYGNYDHFWIVVGVIYACYSMSTYFVDVHSSGAEGIIVSYLTEENCEGEQFIEVCPGGLRRDLYEFKNKHFEAI